MSVNLPQNNSQTRQLPSMLRVWRVWSFRSWDTCT